MIRNYLANKRMHKFLTEMTVTLGKDYGRSAEYTEGQVKAALKKLGYDGELEDVALAIWCSEENARALGLDTAALRKYRGYPVTYGSQGGGGGDGGGD